jgi:hypothetical protein
MSRRTWLLVFFFGTILAYPGSFAMFLIVAGILGIVFRSVSPDAQSGLAMAVTVVLLIALMWSVALWAMRVGAPSGIRVAASLGSLPLLAVALSSAYDLLKPATPDMLAEPTIFEAVRGAARFSLWGYGVLAVGIPLAAHVAVTWFERSRPRGDEHGGTF